MPSNLTSDPILAVAPMLDWTDRHCRYFHRLLTKRAVLYSEMVTTGALIYGDVARHLQFNVTEHPIVLQLGGSDPKELVVCAKLAQKWGYDGINLNCGCPSDRVQKGSFGACLMLNSKLVADCVKALLDATSLPISVKHRIGIDKEQNYSFVCDFVGTVYQSGCRQFEVHARNAWLKGLSPKENRSIPPLKYEYVYQLKKDFSSAKIILNGGVSSNEEIAQHLTHVDGVMVGREAYHNPWLLSGWDEQFFGDAKFKFSRQQIEQQYVQYMQQQIQQNEQINWRNIAKHMLGLRNGLPAARKWRQVWSDHRLKDCSVTQVFQLASQC